MNQPLKTLPPDWEIEVHGPACGWPTCTIIITSPAGMQMRFTHQPDERARILTEQLQDAMGYQKNVA